MKNNDWHWPAGIILTIVLFIGFLVTTFVLANRLPLNLVMDNYYETGVRHQAQIDRVARTNALDVKIGWQYNAGTQRIMLTYPDSIPGKQITGSVTLYRPSDASMDKSWPIKFDGDSEQIVDISGLHGGFWRLKIFWVLEDKEYFLEDELIVQRKL